MAPAVPAVFLALLAAQATGAGTGAAASVQTGEGDVGAEKAATADAATRFDEPLQTGAPLLPSTTPPGKGMKGAVLDVGIMSLFRAQTLGTAGSGQGWGLDAEFTPSIGVGLDLPTLRLAGGYAARITVPIDAVGADAAVLQTAYLRVAWDASPMWTFTVTGKGTYGQNSQLTPLLTPGAPGVPPAGVSPIRSFATYPYIGADAGIQATGQLSQRLRLRLSAGYFDEGGLGAEGQAAQPRAWGPTAEAVLDWDATRTGTLGSTMSFSDSFVVGGFSIMVGTWKEAWIQRWSNDLETLLSLGAAMTSTESVTFLGSGHLVPTASATLRYYTDVRHSFRLWADAAMAPYVDTYVNSTYQRFTGTTGVDWYPAAGWFVGVYGGAGLNPAAAPPPQAYGTLGASASWAPWKWLTFSVGGFVQSQGTASTMFDISALGLWTTYCSVTFLDVIGL